MPSTTLCRRLAGTEPREQNSSVLLMEPVQFVLNGVNAPSDMIAEGIGMHWSRSSEGRVLVDSKIAPWASQHGSVWHLSL